jgi:hypothetical protein
MEMKSMDKRTGNEGAMKLVLYGCGRVHITCGPMTLHLEREEFLTFADGVEHLLAMVKQAPAGLVPAARQGARPEVCH